MKNLFKITLLTIGISFSAETNHVIKNIDILGVDEIPAIYILDNSDELDGLLLTRDFVSDPFFMVNVDREQFETQVFSLIPQNDSLKNTP